MLDPQKQKILATLKPILDAAGIPDPDMSRFYVGKTSIVEESNYNGLSQAIIDRDMPAIANVMTLDHYTKPAAGRSIIESQEFRLAQLTYRVPEGELQTFASEHGLTGYVDAAGNHTPFFKEAADNLFFGSFTVPPVNDHHWAGFGENGTGYRLRLEVKAGRGGQLREMRYQGPVTLQKQIDNALRDAGLPRLLVKSVSRIGAFYLPVIYDVEGEVRLLAKRFDEAPSPVISGPQGEYWPIPIGQPNDTAEMKLTEIGVKNLDPDIVRARLAAKGIATPVVQD